MNYMPRGIFSWLSAYGDIIRAKPNYTQTYAAKLLLAGKFCEGLEFWIEF